MWRWLAVPAAAIAKCHPRQWRGVCPYASRFHARWFHAGRSHARHSV